MECADCGGKIVVKVVPYYYRDQMYLGNFEAEVCQTCNSIHFTEQAFYEIEKVAKIRRIWGVKRLPSIEKMQTVTASRTLPIVNLTTLYGNVSNYLRPEYTAVGVN